MLIKQRITQSTKTNFLYFNCDLLDSKRDIVDLVEEYLLNFPSTERRYLFLDEITAVRDSFLAIKYLVDSGYEHNLTYIITGSNTINIKKTGEFLPGRRGAGIDFNFLPLSFKTYLQLLYPDIDFEISIFASESALIEMKNKFNLSAELEKYLKTGGFPRVINEFSRHDYIPDDIFTIYRTWITSELAKSDKKEYIAKRILERSIENLSSDISYNAFAQDSDVGSHNTISDYLDFFNSAYILSIMYNYDLDRKQVSYRKNKKVYFTDPFIFSVIEAWLSGKPRQDYDYINNAIQRSQMMENLIYLKLKQDFNEVYFHRNQGEIDFVAGENLLESKYTNKISPEDYKALAKFPQNKILVTKNKLEKQENILLIPVELFLICMFA